MATRVIVPAAGVGSRLSAPTPFPPKCLIKVGAQTIAERAIEIFGARGIQDFVYITGFQAALVEMELGLRARFIHNPFYRISNSIASVWLAREELSTDHDLIIMNSDVFFEPQVIERLLADGNPITMLCDRSRIDEADYRLGLDGDRIVRFGKDLANSSTDAEYVGIARIRAPFVRVFTDRLDLLVKQGRLSAWWEDALFDLAREGMPVHACDIAGHFWGEVDRIEDYQRLVQRLP